MYRLFFLLLLTFSIPYSFANVTPSYQQQAEAIYDSMSLDEKVGQLLLPSLRLLSIQSSDECKQALEDQAIDNNGKIKACGFDQIATYHIGSIFVDASRYYNEPTIQGWQLLATLVKQAHQSNTKDPLLLLGIDAVHGNNHVADAVIFPHNINLGVTHNAKLVHHIAQLTTADVLHSGFNWIYAPTVAVAQDLRWGRTYESYGQLPHLVERLADSYMKGTEYLPGQPNQRQVIATAKHFFGDGGTQYGLDEGNLVTRLSFDELWALYGKGYVAALNNQLGSVMASYNAINGQPMHFGGPWNSITRFKQDGLPPSSLPFAGFVVADYNGASRAGFTYNKLHPEAPLHFIEMIAKTINAGVDMLMHGVADYEIPYDMQSQLNFKTIGELHEVVKQAVKQGLISEQRLKEAVTRILAVKLSLNKTESAINYEVLNQQQSEVALKAAEQSLVLLKNEQGILPLNPQDIKNIVLVGDADDIGIQNGGWTITWQGQKGNTYFENSQYAFSLLRGLKKRFSANTHYYQENELTEEVLPKLMSNNTIAILVLAEPPYAEYMGDIANDVVPDHWYAFGIKDNANSYMPVKQNKTLVIAPNEKQGQLLEKLKMQGIPIITVLYSGRPMVITQGKYAPLPMSNAFIAAFLPGTTGGLAIANALTGRYHFRSEFQEKANTLTFPWPRDDNDITQHFAKGALFPIDFGLSTQPEIEDYFEVRHP